MAVKTTSNEQRKMNDKKDTIGFNFDCAWLAELQELH